MRISFCELMSDAKKPTIAKLLIVLKAIINICHQG